MIDHARLLQLLCYDSATGIFSWRVVRKKGRPGRPAGVVGTLGYRVITIDGKPYRAHRLAWFYVYGTWPNGDLDHANNVKDDNRLVNLREATDAQNNANRPRPKNNKSGFKGVFWYARIGKWRATVGLNSKRIYLGDFATVEDAHNAYVAAATDIHSQFARIA